MEAQVWVGSLHLYNSGHLIGQWYDLEIYQDDAESLEEDAKQYIIDNLPEGECEGEATEELWCFDVEGLSCGEVSPSTAVELYSEIMEKADKLGYDAELILELESDGYTVDEHTCIVHTEKGDWCELAGMMEEYEEAGRFADYIDWEAMYKYNYDLISVNSGYVFICNH